MHYSAYYSVDVVNGPGTRCTLFVSGCEHQCVGCYNQKTWRCDFGHRYTQTLQQQILHDLADPQIRRRGLTLTGGDPLHPANLSAVFELIQQVKQQLPEKDIWCWTGYRFEELSAAQQALLPYLDVLVDGRFEQQLADKRLIWRGSSNQRIIQLPHNSKPQPQAKPLNQWPSE